MTAQARQRAPGTAPAFRDPNDRAASELGIELREEIVEYQRRLTRLLAQDDGSRSWLVNAYRRAIRERREMLRDLPRVP